MLLADILGLDDRPVTPRPLIRASAGGPRRRHRGLALRRAR
jgi:hypothetical protein